MQNKTIAILLANGFEEIETIGTIDILRRAGVDVCITSITQEKQVSGAHNVQILADTCLGALDIKTLQGVILPGGAVGAQNMKNSQAVIELVKKVQEAQGLIAAICAAPIVLDEAGVLDGKKFTCYPGFEEQIKAGHYENNMVVQDGQLITAYGPGATLHFAIALVRHLVDNETADALIAGMLIS